jgi:hypothetical protein
MARSTITITELLKSLPITTLLNNAYWAVYSPLGSTTPWGHRLWGTAVPKLIHVQKKYPQINWFIT